MQSSKIQPKDTEFVNEICYNEDNDDLQFLDQDILKATDNNENIKSIYFAIFTFLYNIAKLNFYSLLFLFLYRKHSSRCTITNSIM